VKAFAPISGAPLLFHNPLPQSILHGFPQGFGLRQASAALEWPRTSKAPEGWRTPRRYRAVFHLPTFNLQPVTIN
jgi:hypothetical protein